MNEEEIISRHMAELGKKKNPRKGFGSLTPEKRKELQRKAAKAKSRNAALRKAKREGKVDA